VINITTSGRVAYVVRRNKLHLVSHLGIDTLPGVYNVIRQHKETHIICRHEATALCVACSWRAPWTAD